VEQAAFHPHLAALFGYFRVSSSSATSASILFLSDPSLRFAHFENKIQPSDNCSSGPIPSGHNLIQFTGTTYLLESAVAAIERTTARPGEPSQLTGRAFRVLLHLNINRWIHSALILAALGICYLPTSCSIPSIEFSIPPINDLSLSPLESELCLAYMLFGQDLGIVPIIGSSSDRNREGTELMIVDFALDAERLAALNFRRCYSTIPFFFTPSLSSHHDGRRCRLLFAGIPAYAFGSGSYLNFRRSFVYRNGCRASFLASLS